MFTRSSVRRRLATVLVAALTLSLAGLTAFLTSVIIAAPASAHAVLIRITPARGAQLTTPPTHVVLEFDAPVSATFTTVVVTNATGVTVVRGKAAVLGGTVTQTLIPNLASGDYRVAYRVTSSDGHPISGESTFTLTRPPATTRPTAADTSTTMSPVPVATTPPAQDAQSRSLGVAVSEGWLPLSWLPIATAAALIGAGVGFVLWLRRRG